jgi:hypothetical protein
MAYTAALTVVIAVFGCPLTSVRVPNPGLLILGLGAIAIALLPVLVFLQEKKKSYLRDSILVALWALLFTLMLGYPVTVAARLGMHIPLQDALFQRWDAMLGVNIPSIKTWASRHWLGIIASDSYPLLFPYMRVAVLLPILAGKLRHAQKFLVANLAAFAIGLPIFALFPAIGPWFGYHLDSRPEQAAAEAMVLLIRQPGLYEYRYPLGVICFPSFHVIWAILCAQALWVFRLLRVPVSLFSALIVFSTLTTGNHYLVDVLTGMGVAVAAVYIANRLSYAYTEYETPSLQILKFWGHRRMTQ